MQKFFFKILLFVLILVPFYGNSQIIAPNADFKDTTAYSISGEKDTIYFFNINNDQKSIVFDTAGYKGYSVIQWESFESGTGFINISTTAIKLDLPETPETQGYRLTINDGFGAISKICWVVINDFSIEIETKDSKDYLLTGAYTSCESYGPIWVRLDTTSFSYYHPSTLDAYTLNLNYTNSTWKTSVSIEEADKGKMKKKTGIIGKFKYLLSNPYYKDSWYILEVSDNAGLLRKDSVFVVSKMPLAKFITPEYLAPSQEEYYPNAYNEAYTSYTKEIYSAPAWFLFDSDSSENAHSYTWNFGDSTDVFNTNSDTAFHTYQNHGFFFITLTAKHNDYDISLFCEDKSEPFKLEIAPPELSAPNAFATPGGNEPIWRFYDVSIIDFEISIFSRIGRRVHHFKGDIREWEGWNGSFNNSNNTVSTGVYYYVVKDYTKTSNIDPNYKDDPSVWQTESSDGGGGTNPNSEQKVNTNNTQFRGFIHVFNTND